MIAYYEKVNMTDGVSSVAVEDEGKIVARFRYGYRNRDEFGELTIYNEAKRCEIEEALDYLLDWKQWVDYRKGGLRNEKDK